MKGFFKIVCLILVSIFLFCGCGSGYENGIPNEGEDSNPEIIQSMVNGDLPEKIIYIDNITVETKDVKVFLAKVENEIDSKGYISNQSISKSEKSYIADLTIKLKTDNRKVFLTLLEEWGDVISLKSSSENVTLKYLKLENTINENSTMMAYYKDLYEKELAKEIPNQSMIGGYLASYQNYLKLVSNATLEFNNLKNQTDFSTLYLRVREVGKSATISKEVSGDLGTAFSSSWINFINFLIGFLTVFLYILPFALLIILILTITLLLRKYLRKKYPDRFIKKIPSYMGSSAAKMLYRPKDNKNVDNDLTKDENDEIK